MKVKINKIYDLIKATPEFKNLIMKYKKERIKTLNKLKNGNDEFFQIEKQKILSKESNEEYLYKEIKTRQKINEEIKNSNLKNPIFKIPLSYINKNEIRLMLNLKKSIKPHNKKITSLSIFPSGKIISISYDKSIKIYNSNFIIIQNITEAHKNEIIYQ